MAHTGDVRVSREFVFDTLPDMTGAELKVYLMLRAHRNNKKNDPQQGTAFPSEAKLAQLCNLSVRGVEESIKRLKKRGLIAIRRRESTSGGRGYNVYYIP